MSVPAPFRAALGDQAAHGIVAFRSFKEPAIEAFSLDDMNRMAANLEELDQFSEERDDLATIFADALQLQIDGEGRIVLPPHLAAHAGIGESALFVSNVSHFQIWEPETYAKKSGASRDRLLARKATVKARPFGANGGQPGGGPGSEGSR